MNFFIRISFCNKLTYQCGNTDTRFYIKLYLFIIFFLEIVTLRVDGNYLNFISDLSASTRVVSTRGNEKKTHVVYRFSLFFFFKCTYILKIRTKS